MASQLAVGFGFKTAWLAFRGSTPEQGASALRLSGVKAADWSTAIQASYATNGSAVAVTPPIHRAGGEWVLATGRSLLLHEPDLADLSKRSGTEVQYFLSERITETHGWARAAGGNVIRAFVWSGESGEILKWVGRPDAFEQTLGLPDVDRADQNTNDTVFDIGIDEDTVMAIAGKWSVDPAALDEKPSAGGPLIGALP